MNPKIALSGAVIALAVLATAACEDSTTNVEVASDPGGIRVSGRGEVRAQPDTGFFTASIEVSAKTVAEARDTAAKAAEDVIDSLKKNGVRSEDLQTTTLSINAEYFYPRDGGQPTITGYRVMTSVDVTIRDLDRFSKTVDDAVSAGGDATRLSSIRFDIEDKAELLKQARELAMKDAKEKAEQLARLAGADLGALLSIVETTSSEPPPTLAGKLADEARAGTIPIEPGTGTVVLSVDVRWAIR